MFDLNEELDYFTGVLTRGEELEGRTGVRPDVLSGDKITDIMDVLGTLNAARSANASAARRGEQMSLEGFK